MVAVGASGLQAGALSDLVADPGKPWTMSTTLRGFYDTNPSTAKSGSQNDDDSFGYEVSPSLQFSFPWEQTSLSFGYVYSMKYYGTRPAYQSGHVNNTHHFNAALTHAFSERYSLSVRDSFVIGQEPDMLRAGNTYDTFQFVSGDNKRNFGSITFFAQMTPEWGVEVGYANTLYDYQDNNYSVIPGIPAGGPPWLIPPVVNNSLSGINDRIDNLAHLDVRYQIMPQTVGVIGYQFRETLYTGNEPIYYDPSRNNTDKSRSLNARSHYGYAGVDHNFRKDLTGSIRAGGRYTDYYNNKAGQNTGSPYVMSSLQYVYLQGSYVQLGSSYDYSSIYQGAFRPDPSNGDLTLNANAFTIFGTISHRITQQIRGTLSGQFQNSDYYGGLNDGDTDRFYTAGVNLQYQFPPMGNLSLSAEVGWSYDKLDSQVYQSYNRNRVYVGVTGSF